MPSQTLLPTDPTTLQQLLAAAQNARHALLTGTAPVEVDFGTYRTKFNVMNKEAIESYIRELQAAIAGTCSGGALAVIF